MDYSYKLYDFFGDWARLTVYEDGASTLDYMDYDAGEMRIGHYSNEDAAYNAAHKMGYRD